MPFSVSSHTHWNMIFVCLQYVPQIKEYILKEGTGGRA